ncbi:MAG TPA: SDR family NAD(P)-dependent oxidoreductase, partial [Candidatus Methylomirabilis sp.]|nr:SDR family NAD(P)-dependent oxidoreductase [Candidatus Methylomirabilis sp.]
MESETKALDDRVILVTGGSRGIGFAVALAFVKQGARVAICAQEAPRLAAAEKALTNSGTVFAAIADVGDRRQVNALVESTRRRL